MPLDDLGLVSGAEDRLPHAEAVQPGQQVFEKRPAIDVGHRLRPRRRNLRKPRARAADQDDGGDSGHVAKRVPLATSEGAASLSRRNQLCTPSSTKSKSTTLPPACSSARATSCLRR